MLKLTDYPSGNVKAIAYEGLIRKQNINVFPLLKKSLNDTLTFVYFNSGCFVNTHMLSDYLFSHLTNLNDDAPPMINSLEINLKAVQKNEIIALFKQRKSKEDYYRKEYYKSLR